MKGKFKVDKIFFPKNTSKVESGEFCIVSCKLVETLEGEVKLNRYGNCSFKGILPAFDLNKDRSLEFIIKGEEIETNQFGTSYKIIFSNVAMEIGTDEEKKLFLSSVLTQAQIIRLYDTFENPFEVIEQEDIEKLMTVKGFSEKTAQKIIDRFQATKDYQILYTSFPTIEFTDSLVRKLVSAYKSPSVIVDVLKTNPYMLARDVRGIGFSKADEIAMQVGVPPDSKIRIAGFIEHYLGTRGEEGYSWVSADELYTAVCDNIGEIIDSTWANALTDLYNDGIITWGENGSYIALVYYYELEKKISKELLRLLHAKPKSFVKENKEESVKAIQDKQGWEFTEEQRLAIETALNSNVCIIAGLSGTGKTSAVSGVLASMEDDIRFAQCALSGKASSRLAEVTGESGFTIHRLLGYSVQQGFKHNDKNKLPHDLIILDETSMVGGDIFYSLVSAIESGKKLIMLGDEGQLEAIGSLNLFKDMIDCGAIPVVKLTKLHRQALKSAVITEAHKVRHGSQLTTSGWIGEETRGELQDLKLDIYADKLFTPIKIMENYKRIYDECQDVNKIITVVPTKFSGDGSTLNINSEIQDYVNPFSESKNQINIRFKYGERLVGFDIREGDRVLVKANNYKTTDVNGIVTPIFNGFLGTVECIRSKYNDEDFDVNDAEFDEMIVNFDTVGKVIVPKSYWRNMLLGYAITGHSMQGSECDNIIVGIDFSGYNMLTREWLYTAITRAKKYCVVCAETKSLQYSCNISKVPLKQTFLPRFLKGELEVV